jgi:ubiquitin-protein ligase
MAAVARLRKDYMMLCKEPVPLAIACPTGKNILEWRFVIKGIGDYEGGYYQGKLVFPSEYPWRPPSVIFLTPTGRFEVNKRICLSISDYHPELWTPSWTVGTILTGIVSFFNSEETSTGTVRSTLANRQNFALNSHTVNKKDKLFIKLFGEDPTPLFVEAETKMNEIRDNLIAENVKLEKSMDELDLKRNENITYHEISSIESESIHTDNNTSSIILEEDSSKNLVQIENTRK